MSIGLWLTLVREFCLPPGHAVLLRAIEPTTGLNQMVAKRGVELHRVLCSGPGRLIEALGIDGSLNGLRLDRSPFRLNFADERAEVVVGTRIGISQGIEIPWRFGLSWVTLFSRPLNPVSHPQSHVHDYPAGIRSGVAATSFCTVALLKPTSAAILRMLMPS